MWPEFSANPVRVSEVVLRMPASGNPPSTGVAIDGSTRRSYKPAGTRKVNWPFASVVAVRFPLTASISVTTTPGMPASMPSMLPFEFVS